MSNDITQLARQTIAIYQRNAHHFTSQRPKALIEKPWLERFRNLMPKNANILDMGCGDGDPIARYFMANGHPVTGMDASSNMIDLARENDPTGDWRVADMRDFELPETFDGIIGWHSFFHLTPDEQRRSLPIIAKHLNPLGALLLTVGPTDGEVAGHVGEDPVYHASLSLCEYSEILAGLGIAIRDFTARDPDCYGSTLLLAQKSADETPIGRETS